MQITFETTEVKATGECSGAAHLHIAAQLPGAAHLPNRRPNAQCCSHATEEPAGVLETGYLGTGILSGAQGWGWPKKRHGAVASILFLGDPTCPMH